MYKRVLFIGSKESGFTILNELFRIAPSSVVGCVTINDSNDTRSKFECFKEFCITNDIEISIMSGPGKLSEAVKHFSPDLCIVMGWYNIIPSDILSSVSGGFIGIHYSLLPKHRGFSPVVWAMIAGERETGFSVFSFDDGMDTGDIWYQEKVKIEYKDHIADVLGKLDKSVSLFFRNHYLDILLGNLKPHNQSENDISYGARRVPEDGLIDWNKKADVLYDFIRAQSKPYPGAFTVYKNEKHIIWNAEVFPYPIQGKPGQVGLIDSANNRIIIVCGDNTGLAVSEMERNGILHSCSDFVRSINCVFGE